MPKIITTITVNAPIDRVFDLSRSIDFHMYTQKHRDEKAIAGKQSGLINLDEQVQWKSRHLGLVQSLTAKITMFSPPFQFRDTMVAGAFKSFDHDHIFSEENGVVHVTDIFDYKSPFGWIGGLADVLFLKRYMTRFFKNKNAVLKSTLETEEWRKFLFPDS